VSNKILGYKSEADPLVSDPADSRLIRGPSSREEATTSVAAACNGVSALYRVVRLRSSRIIASSTSSLRRISSSAKGRIINSRFTASPQSTSPAVSHCRVRRQLLFPISDNYFSRSTTITSFPGTGSSSTLVLTGAEGKALQGCNLSADSGARPGGAGIMIRSFGRCKLISQPVMLSSSEKICVFRTRYKRSPGMWDTLGVRRKTPKSPAN
jgi:hypothetical protein